MAARGVVSTTNVIESCPPTVRQGNRRTARANAPIVCCLSDAEVTALIEEIAALEGAAQRRADARPS